MKPLFALLLTFLFVSPLCQAQAIAGDTTTHKNRESIAYYPFAITGYRDDLDELSAKRLSMTIPSWILDNLNFIGSQLNVSRVPYTALDIDTIRAKADGKYNIQKNATNIKLASSFIDEKSVAYLLTGSINCSKNTFDLNIILSDPEMNYRSIYRFDTFGVDNKNLPDIIKIISNELFVVTQSNNRADYKVAVIKFAPERKSKSNPDIPAFENMGFETKLYEILRLHGNFQVVPIDRTKKYITDESTVKLLFDSLGVDAIVGGYFDDYVKTDIKIKPVIYSKLLSPEALNMNPAYVGPTYLGDVNQKFGNALLTNLNALSSRDTNYKFNNADISFSEELKKSISFLNSNISLAQLSGQRALSKAANTEDSINALNNLANIDMLNKEYESASEYFNKSVSLSNAGENVTAVYGLAQIEIRYKNYEAALPLLRRILDWNPLLPETRSLANIYGSTGLIYYFLDNTDSAKFYLNKAILSNSSLLMSNYLLLRIATDSNDFAAVEKSLNNIKAKQDTNSLGILTAIKEHFDDKITEGLEYGNMPVAEAYARINYMNFPDTLTLYNYVHILLLQNKQETADQYINEGINNRLFEEDEIYKSLGDILRTSADSMGKYNATDYSNSIKYFKLHAARYPEDIDIYRRIGSDYFRLRNYDSALVYYRRILELYPAPVNFLNISELLVMMGKNADAAKYLEECRIKMADYPEQSFYKNVMTFLVYANNVLSRSKDEDASYADLTSQLDKKDPIMGRWSFTTFKKWVQKDSDAKKSVREKILSVIDIIEAS